MTTAPSAEPAWNGTRAEIEDLEQRRCNALLARDIDALRAMIPEDLLHVHASGRVDRYESYFEFLRRVRFLELERGPLEITLAGDHCVVASGSQRMVITDGKAGSAPRAFHTWVTQVWRKSASGWRQLHFHATKMQDSA